MSWESIQKAWQREAFFRAVDPSAAETLFTRHISKLQQDEAVDARERAAEVRLRQTNIPCDRQNTSCLIVHKTTPVLQFGMFCLLIGAQVPVCSATESLGGGGGACSMISCTVCCCAQLSYRSALESLEPGISPRCTWATVQRRVPKDSVYEHLDAARRESIFEDVKGDAAAAEAQAQAAAAAEAALLRARHEQREKDAREFKGRVKAGTVSESGKATSKDIISEQEVLVKLRADQVCCLSGIAAAESCCCLQYTKAGQLESTVRSA